MDRKSIAYAAPFLIFVAFLSVSGVIDRAHLLPSGVGSIYILYPLQTLVCSCVLAFFWRDYHLQAPRMAGLAALIGALVFAVWISPQICFHQAPRLQGFDPGLFAANPAVYWPELVVRFLRLVIVVPVLEEVFWRGFLLRYFIREDFVVVPFGTFHQKANLLVAAGFMLEHSRPDWPAALAAGFLYNLVAYRTRSLSSCILAHAVTNALLGAYIMETHQWGFW